MCSTTRPKSPEPIGSLALTQTETFSLRTNILQTEPDVLRRQMGNGAAPIREIIPEVLEKLGGVEPAPAMDPDQARFRLFDSITAFLRKTSEDSPLLLVLDDLHWADRPSLLLLEFVARQLEGSRIHITGTYRDAEAPAGAYWGIPWPVCPVSHPFSAIRYLAYRPKR